MASPLDSSDAPITHEQWLKLREHWYDGGRLSEWQIGRALDAACAISAAQQTVAPNVDGRDFYELCQTYRHSKELMPYGTPNTVQAFNDLRGYVKTGRLPWPSYDISPPIDRSDAEGE